MSSPSQPPTYTVLVYGQREQVRVDVRTAIGRRLGGGVGRIEYVECTDVDALLRLIDAGGIDVAILDGEAQPTGGMGISRQLKYEIADCPSVCVLIARADDRWLATWSLADATLVYPLDALTAAHTMTELVRQRAAGTPVRR
jgi:DNA-binding response OmpR family regulator